MSEQRCTCCKEPRQIVKPDGGEWMHVSDQQGAETRHIHGDWSASDCDGPMVGSDVKRIWSLNWDYIDPRKVAIGGTPPTFDDLWRHMVASAIPAHADHCTVEICGGDTISVHESTDEGGRSTRMYVCDDPWCAFDEGEVRDLQAEAAGY